MNARESLGVWATNNPAPALLIAILIIGVAAGVYAITRKGGRK